MDAKSFPAIPEDLLTALEARFPQQSPQLNETPDAMRWRGGQCSVVTLLRAVFEEQNRTSYDIQVNTDVQS